MPRGEFRLGNGLIVPNQFTIVGMQQVLKAAFQQSAPPWYMGLCAVSPADALALSQMEEPTIGVNGYGRQGLPLNITNWPGMGVTNGESYVESRIVTFIATGAYDQPVNRLFLTDGVQVIAVSSAIIGGLQIIDADFTTSYRLYFR